MKKISLNTYSLSFSKRIRHIKKIHSRVNYNQWVYLSVVLKNKIKKTFKIWKHSPVLKEEVEGRSSPWETWHQLQPDCPGSCDPCAVVAQSLYSRLGHYDRHQTAEPRFWTFLFNTTLLTSYILYSLAKEHPFLTPESHIMHNLKTKLFV